MPVTVDMISKYTGREVEDEYGRTLGVLVSFYSDVEGVVEAVEVKLADRSIEKVEADRVKIGDGKLLIVPEWKHKAVKVIEALDRAYKRRKAIESIEGGDLPSEVVASFKLRLAEEIKKLKRLAEEAKETIKRRIDEISDESLHVARAIASLKMLYFSGEVGEAHYTQSINHLRRLRDALTKEREDAKRILDKLEKTLQAASTGVAGRGEEKKPQPAHAPAAPAAVPKPPVSTPGDAIVVHVAEG